jgi:cytochrome c-type biogenesis protein CcmH/NrfF
VTLPLAHVGHYLWILYLLPVAIVLAGIVKSQLIEKRRQDPGASNNRSSRDEEHL